MTLANQMAVFRRDTIDLVSFVCAVVVDNSGIRRSL